jgi:uncharacterized protein (TIGR02266 family)
MRGDNNFYTGLTEDISEGGIFIATCHGLPLGTPVILAFTLPGAWSPLEVRGTVQWLREPAALASGSAIFSSDDDRVKPGMGVRFDALDRRSTLAIRAFMARRDPEFFD